MRWWLIQFRRYIFDTLSGIITIYGFFLIIFFGARIFSGGGPRFGETLEAVVVAYGVWALTMFSLGALTYDLTQEAQLGTLEQISMSPFGLSRVLVARVFAMTSGMFVVWVVLLVLMMVTSGRWLNLDVVSILPVLVATLLGVIGVGFVLGGLAIVFKRIQQALQIHQILLFGLVVAPIEDVPFVKYLPLAWGAHLLRRIMAEGASIFEISPGDLLFLAVNSAFYFFGGIAVFRLFERAARERGLLGHY
jgi:ABC-2 type transport system permease protein